MAAELFCELTNAPDFAIVDAHHHLWDLSMGHYPWLQQAYCDDSFMGDYRRLCSTYGPADYLADTRGLRIGATVHVEAERAREESLDETIWLDSLARRHKGLAVGVVPWVDLWDDGVADHIDAHLSANIRVKGVRAKPRILTTGCEVSTGSFLPGGLSDPRLSQGFGVLMARGLAWDLRVPWCHLTEAAERLADAAQLRVVVNHSGLLLDRSEAAHRQWLRSMTALADLPNIYVKLSEPSASVSVWDAKTARRIVDCLLDLFGSGRCMFASNQPVGGLTVDVAILIRTIADAVKSGAEREMRSIFMETACRAYNIDVSEVVYPAIE